MFVRKKCYENAIQKVKIEIGDLIGCDTKEEAFVVLKEMSTMDTTELQQADGDQQKVLDLFHKKLPLIIDSHNLFETETELMTNEAVADFIYEKMQLTIRVVDEYCKKIFFIPASEKKKK